MGPHKKSIKMGQTKKSAYANFIHKQNKLKQEAKTNLTRQNHVSATDLSRGGFPFHFAGPKKGKQ